MHISRRLAGLLGGDVSLVHSEIGKGSCFRLSIPLEVSLNAIWVDYIHPMTSLSDADLAIAPKQLLGRVLLAEDGKDNQKLIAFHLKKAGATVSIADNGIIALEMIEQGNRAGTPYDLLITDIQNARNGWLRTRSHSKKTRRGYTNHRFDSALAFRGSNEVLSG